MGAEGLGGGGRQAGRRRQGRSDDAAYEHLPCVMSWWIVHHHGHSHPRCHAHRPRAFPFYQASSAPPRDRQRHFAHFVSEAASHKHICHMNNSWRPACAGRPGCCCCCAPRSGAVGAASDSGVNPFLPCLTALIRPALADEAGGSSKAGAGKAGAGKEARKDTAGAAGGRRLLSLHGAAPCLSPAWLFPTLVQLKSD